MHNPVKTGEQRDFQCRGVQLDVFHTAYARVAMWGEPILRNSFWRCYLPVSDGASVRSSTHEWPLKAGELMLIPPDSPVTGHASAPFRLHYVHFGFSMQVERPTPLTFRAPADLRQCLDRGLEERDETAYGLATLRLLTWAVNAIPLDSLRIPSHDAQLERAYKVMKESLDRRLTNAGLAKSLKMSESSLLRMFRQSEGTTPQKAHLRLRLERAAALLRDTTASIDEIASECGFWDRNHFTRAFTREWDSPPARYRQTATPL